MAYYCATPPFVNRAIVPNVMIVLDNSVSMFNFAYNYNGSNISTGFDPNASYYGYFDSNYWYKYESGKFVSTALKSSRNKSSNEWDGNFLNWLTMRRIDIARKVLVGGKYSGGYLTGEEADQDSRGYVKKVTSAEDYTSYVGTRYFHFDLGRAETSKFEVCSNCSCTWSEQHRAYLCSCSGCSGHLNVRLKLGERPEGVVQRVGNRVRWGLTFYHKNDGRTQGGYVKVNIAGSNIQDMIGNINNKRPDSNAPLAETLWTVAGYFAQEASMLGGPGPRYQSGDYQINNNVDPYNYGTGGNPIPAWCAKSFVIYITDGEPCGDDYLPDELKNYAANYGGYSYSGSLPSCSAGGNNPWVEDVALYVHTNDLRDDLEGKQTLTIYPVSAFGSGSELLKDVAINGGFIDKNNNDIPDLQSEWDENRDGTPDNYYEAQNGYELENALLRAVADILKRASSGTAVSVLSTSTRGSAILNQAYFLPQMSSGTKELSWVGELKGFWVDPKGQIREDTDQGVCEDHADASNTWIAQLEYNKDNILKFFLDAASQKTKLYLFDSDSNGKVKSPCGLSHIKTLDEAKAIWDIGCKLWSMSADSRHIFTGVDLNGDSMIDKNDVFSADYSSNLARCLRACDSEDAQHIIDYIRGNDVDICIDSDNKKSCRYSRCTKDHRDRTVTIDESTGVWKLGDIIYSTPRVLSHFPIGTYNIRYHDNTYRDFIRDKVYDPAQRDPIKRDDYLFVGANDGMLHCFYLGRIKEDPDTANCPGVKAAIIKPSRATHNIGEEVWTFIPMNVLPYLKYLAYPNYCHIYYVDQRPMLVDASIGGSATDTKTKDSWRTILIGELGFGGSPNPPVNAPVVNGKKVGLSSIFALDITDPKNPNLLWEFTDPDLGFTTSYPTVVRIGEPQGSGQDDGENGNWYVVLGSGPRDYNGGIPPQQGYIYVINLRNGALAKKLPLPPNAYAGDCVAVDPNNDYTVDAIYCGTVEEQKKKQTESSFTGRMLRILTKGENPSQWTADNVSVLVDAKGPITSSPEFAFDDQGNLWCYFGSGKYFGEEDKSNEDQQYIYGVKDTCWGYHDGAWGYKTTCSPVTNIYDTTDVEVAAGQISDYMCLCEGGEIKTCPDGDPAKGTDTDGDPICNCGDMVVTKVTGVTISGCGGSDGEDWQTCANRIASNYDGWRLKLNDSSPAERVISKPSVIGQLAIFTTFTPNPDVCGFGGSSALYALYYKAGIPYKQPSIFRKEAYLKGIIERSVSIGQGAPAIGEGIVSKKVGKKLKTYIQLSTGQVVEVTNQPVFLPEKIQFWIEK